MSSSGFLWRLGLLVECPHTAPQVGSQQLLAASAQQQCSRKAPELADTHNKGGLSTGLCRQQASQGGTLPQHVSC